MEHRLPFQLQLKYEREKRGLSQAALAERLQIDFKTVHRWETGKSVPHPFHRQKLCELFGISTEELGLVGFEKSRERSDVTANQEDWGDAPRGSSFYGREKELGQLEQWILAQRCQVVAILGIGGIGKTALSTQIAEQLKPHFVSIFWRSLQDALPFELFLRQCLRCISGQQQSDLPETVNEQLSLLLYHLQNHRCLLVLDNAESIMQEGRRAGQYRDGYEYYGRLLQCLGESQHQSCLLITSREKPKEVALLEGSTSLVRSLLLEGIGFLAGKEILKDKGLSGTNEHWTELVYLYSGNPLALKLVSQVIREVFGGEIPRFLQEKEIAFGDINDLISEQFRRLSSQEQELLYWLAIEREAVGLEYLFDDLVRPVLKGEMLTALDSLRRRCLIEMRGVGQFTLQPVIMEYMTGALIRSLAGEFLSEIGICWTNYTFYKAQSKEYIRDSQTRVILAPVAQQLLLSMGIEEMKRKAYETLTRQRQVSPLQQGYIASNILKVLLHVGSDLRGADFSSLRLRQMYLQDVALPEVTFAHAHFSSSVFKGIFGNVLSVALSSYEPLLTMGTATGEIWTYQLLSGTPLMHYDGHTDGVWSVAFHPNGNMFASGSDDQTIRVWNVDDGRCLRKLQGHTNRVRAVTFSPDGQMLASGSDDQTIRLWDVHTGDCLHVFSGHTDRVWSIAFYPDGFSLATGSTDGTIRLWGVPSGECLQVFHGHTSWVRSVAFSSDGSMLASGSDDQTIRLWDVTSGSCCGILDGHTNRIWSCVFSPDGSYLISGSEDQSIRLWDIKSRTCFKLLSGHVYGVRSVAVSSDGRTLVSGGDDQAVRVWELETGSCLRVLQGYAKRVWSVACSADGQSLVSCSEDHSIRLWHTSSGSCVKAFNGQAHRAKCAVLSPDGTLVASGGEDQAVRLWDVATGRCLHTLRGHENWVRSIAFSMDGKLLVSGGEDHCLRLWDTEKAQCLSVMRGHRSWIRSVTFSPDGKFIASGGDDHTIRIWYTDTSRLFRVLQGHTGRVRSVSFSPDGKILASGGEDHHIYLWDVPAGDCLKALHGHTHWVRAVAFSHDGQFLASGGDDPTISVWRVDADYDLKLLHGHTGRVRSLAFDPTSQMLVSGSDDGFIKLWSPQDHLCLKTFLHERPYEGMNITYVSGLTEAQRATLKHLGAVAYE